MDVFISHSSADNPAATALEQELQARGLQCWLDRSEIRSGRLLCPELQSAIRTCSSLVLLWSHSAAASPWVQCEWLTAFHTGAYIVGTPVDDTPLPYWLRKTVYLGLATPSDAHYEALARSLRHPPAGGSVAPAVLRAESGELRDTISQISDMQYRVMRLAMVRRLDDALDAQATLDPLMSRAVELAEAAGIDYQAAKNDLQLLQRRRS